MSHNVRPVAAVAARRVYGVTSQLDAVARNQAATRLCSTPTPFSSFFLSQSISFPPAFAILPALTNKLGHNCLALGSAERCRDATPRQQQIHCGCHNSIISRSAVPYRAMQRRAMPCRAAPAASKLATHVYYLHLNCFLSLIIGAFEYVQQAVECNQRPVASGQQAPCIVINKCRWPFEVCNGILSPVPHLVAGVSLIERKKSSNIHLKNVCIAATKKRKATVTR